MSVPLAQFMRFLLQSYGDVLRSIEARFGAEVSTSKPKGRGPLRSRGLLSLELSLLRRDVGHVSRRVVDRRGVRDHEAGAEDHGELQIEVGCGGRGRAEQIGQICLEGRVRADDIALAAQDVSSVPTDRRDLNRGEA